MFLRVSRAIRPDHSACSTSTARPEQLHRAGAPKKTHDRPLKKKKTHDRWSFKKKNMTDPNLGRSALALSLTRYCAWADSKLHSRNAGAKPPRPKRSRKPNTGFGWRSQTILDKVMHHKSILFKFGELI
jgi:hypothetical protein